MDNIRYYNFMNNVSKRIEKMTKEELNGALQILIPLYTEFYSRYFDNKEVINIKAMIKTFEELMEFASEREIHLDQRTIH